MQYNNLILQISNHKRQNAYIIAQMLLWGCYRCKQLRWAILGENYKNEVFDLLYHRYDIKRTCMNRTNMFYDTYLLIYLSAKQLVHRDQAAITAIVIPISNLYSFFLHWLKTIVILPFFVMAYMCVLLH